MYSELLQEMLFTLHLDTEIVSKNLTALINNIEADEIQAKAGQQSLNAVGTAQETINDKGYLIPWNDEDSYYIPLKEAINLANDDSITIKKMSRQLKDVQLFLKQNRRPHGREYHLLI